MLDWEYRRLGTSTEWVESFRWYTIKKPLKGKECAGLGKKGRILTGRGRSEAG